MGLLISPLKASLKVCTGLGFVATMDGGEGGLSLIKKIAGRHIQMVIRLIIDMNMLNLVVVSLIGGP